ncbi:MAG: MgtC/SapB family protein [Gammaproteobacteria bacterium]
MEPLLHLLLALAVGLLIGLERGWHERGAAEGTRMAGIRTFALVGLLGGLWALLAGAFGAALLGLSFAAFAALVIIAYVRSSATDRDYGTTTAVAALVTFALGALTMAGHADIAVAGAVITATVLSLKPVLHRWISQLEAKELFGTLKLLLISVVVLPVLPNRGYGPWQALNPYQLWWFVVLIAAISFAGYFAIKLTGSRAGIMLTALFGGMASSTATTLNLARLGRRSSLHTVLAAAVLATAGTMFPRILLEVAVVNRSLLPALAGPLAAMTALAYAIALWLWRRPDGRGETAELELANPFELLPALKFGVLLAAIMVLAEGARTWFGDMGVYLLAGVSGLADVDAITLSLARLAGNELSPPIAAQAIVLAATVNTLVKGVLVASIADRRMAMRTTPALMAIILAGAIGLWWAGPG